MNSVRQADHTTSPTIAFLRAYGERTICHTEGLAWAICEQIRPATHGEIGSDNLVIAELFLLHDIQIQNLAADIVSVAAVYDPLLVMHNEDRFVVFGGNSRVTCLKLLQHFKQAPTAELRAQREVGRLNWVIVTS